jgi:hypothetical protein
LFVAVVCCCISRVSVAFSGVSACGEWCVFVSSTNIAIVVAEVLSALGGLLVVALLIIGSDHGKRHQL